MSATATTPHLIPLPVPFTPFSHNTALALHIEAAAKSCSEFHGSWYQRAPRPKEKSTNRIIIVPAWLPQAHNHYFQQIRPAWFIRPSIMCAFLPSPDLQIPRFSSLFSYQEVSSLTVTIRSKTQSTAPSVRREQTAVSQQKG